MSLVDLVYNFLNQPYPLWEYALTEKLVQDKRDQLKKDQFLEIKNYSTARCLINSSVPQEIRLPIVVTPDDEIVYLENPSFDLMAYFYQEHGLIPLTAQEFELNGALSKLNSAMAMLTLVNPVHSCITKLVRSIQLLKQDDVEIDISYSHPKIPFSIFVSVCEDNSTISNLRVAESILHEAMHLKLTLIENVVPLVKPFTGNLYYSPWRDEDRPAQGVLHGLFVFRAILDYFLIIANLNYSQEVDKFVADRIESLKSEIRTLHEFSDCTDLSKQGSLLVFNLIKY